MSTIAARAHSGSTLSAPVRRAAPARRKTSWLSRLARMVQRRPGRALLILSFAGVAGAILLNAVLFQKTRHPAPMASAPVSSQTPRTAERHAAETPAATPAAAPASTPVPPARPSDLVPAPREAQIRPPAPVTNVPRNAAAPAVPTQPPVARAPAPRDPIADLINGADIRPPAEIRGGSKSASVRRSVEN
jgi:cytoskeletal protein RodZ